MFFNYCIQIFENEIDLLIIILWKSSEKDAAFFAAGTAMAFEYLHKMDLVHRDLKPENMLIDPRGYPKVSSIRTYQYQIFISNTDTSVSVLTNTK